MPKKNKKKLKPTTEPDAKFKADYSKARKRLKKLELELKSLKDELFCLAHDPHTGVPHGIGVPHSPGVPHRGGVKGGVPHGGTSGVPHGGTSGVPHGGGTKKYGRKKKK